MSVGFFSPDSDFAGDPEDFENQLREESHVSLEVEHSSPLVGCVRKQTSVSHSSTESEIISLDAGLRLDGLFALDLWDVVMEVSRSLNSTKPPTHPAAGNCSRNHKSNPKQNGSEMLINCRVWATLPQTHTLLKVSLSCTISKTTKLWSKWWLRAEVQQCDTWDDHQRKLHTWWVGPSSLFVEHHESLSAFPQPFSFKAESKVSSPREFKKVLWKRGRQWRSRDLWILYQRTSWMRRKILRKIRVIQTAWKNQELDQSSKGDWCSFSHDPASGHRCAGRQEGQSSSLAAKAKTQTDGKIPSKSSSSKGESSSGIGGKIPCRNFLRRKFTKPSCNFGHPSVCLDYKSDKGCKYGDKCRFRHVEVDVQPSKKSKKSGVTGSVAFFFLESIQLGFVSHAFHLRRSIPRKEGKSGSNHTVGHVAPHHNSGQKRSIARRRSEKCEFHECNPCGPKFAERTRDETLHQERCACRVAWDLANHVCKLKKTDKAAFYYPFEARAMRAPTDSGASMHMLCKKELSWDEMETLRRSRNSTMVLTASGEVQNKRGSTCVRSRSWSLRNRVVAWRHVCSSVNSAQNTVNNRGWPNKGTNYAKRKTSYLLLSWIAVKLWYEFILAITGLIKYIFKSSNRAKWRTRTRKLARVTKNPKQKWKNKEGYQSSLGRPFARPARKVWGVQR